MGRPAKDIDADTVRKLAKLGCNQDEIADFFGVTQSVISRAFPIRFSRRPCGIENQPETHAIQTSDARF